MSKAKVVFTDTMIKKLKPEESDYTRSEGNGFTIRVMPSGSKTWLYLYAVEGKRRKMNLGQYPDVTLETARARFEEAKKQVKNGIDPLDVEEQKKLERIKAPTIADLIDEYLTKHAKVNKRRWQEDERLLNKEVLPLWGKRKAADITKRDVTLLLEGIVERGAPAMSNQTLKLVRKMFNFAVERDILQFSPCVSVKALAPNNKRDRTLSEQEIKTLWNSLDTASVSDEIRRSLKLILLTGARPGEVAGLHEREIDGHWWTLPADRSKNSEMQRTYLTDTALSLIGEYQGKGYVFRCPHESKEQPIAAHAQAVAVRRNLNWPVLHKGKPVFDGKGKPHTENRLGVDQFTPHDLRRTAATMLAQMGFSDEVIDAVLGHKKAGIIKVYNRHKYDNEKQQALEALERKILSIIEGTESKVIPLRRKSAA